VSLIFTREFGGRFVFPVARTTVRQVYWGSLGMAGVQDLRVLKAL
jgi:hypothetical protein